MNVVIDINAIINSAIIAGSNAVVVVVATNGIKKVIEKRNGKNTEKER